MAAGEAPITTIKPMHTHSQYPRKFGVDLSLTAHPKLYVRLLSATPHTYAFTFCLQFSRSVCVHKYKGLPELERFLLVIIFFPFFTMLAREKKSYHFFVCKKVTTLSANTIESITFFPFSTRTELKRKSVCVRHSRQNVSTQSSHFHIIPHAAWSTYIHLYV